MNQNISYAAIFELFAQAVSHNLKFPKLRLQVGNETLVVKLAGDKAKVPGSITLTNDAGYGSPNNKYFGRIEKNGGLVAGRDLTPAVEAFVQRLAENPVEVCAENGKLTGNCSFCQKALTDSNSLAVGYGPTCAKKFNLPWNAAKESRKSRKVEATNAMEDAIALAPADQLLNADEVRGWSGKTKEQELQQEINLVNAGMDV